MLRNDREKNNTMKGITVDAVILNREVEEVPRREQPLNKDLKGTRQPESRTCQAADNTVGVLQNTWEPDWLGERKVR